MKPKIEMIDPHELKPYDKNPRNNDAAIEAVSLSIQRFGFNQPVLINMDNIICAGHTRVEAAKLLELETIPVIRKEMTKAQFIAYNIADNKTGELATWDDDLLRECVSDLGEIEEVEIPGFNEEEIQDLMGSSDLGESKDSESEDEDSPDVKKMTFAFSARQHKIVENKLAAIQSENKLNNHSDALVRVLKGFKGTTKPKRRKK